MITGTARQEKQRALLLYMAGDNDLSEVGLQDVQELCDEGAGDDLYVGVEIDTHGVHDGSIRYEITEAEEQRTGPNRAFRIVIERLNEQDSGSPKTLLSFLKWGLARFPARESIIVIGGHGTGFRSVGRSIAMDEFGSSIDVDELGNVLRLAKTDSNKIGILGFDACLMGLLEISDHLSPYAHYLVGSQEIEPGNGWPYDKVLKALKKEADLRTAACEIAKSYVRSYSRVEKRLTITQSVIDLSKTDVAMRRLGELGEALSSLIDEQGSDVVRKIDWQRTRIQSFRDSEYVDAIHMAQVIGDADLGANVAERCAELREAISDVVVTSERPTHSKKLANAHGISVWFPLSRGSYAMSSQKYRELSGVHRYPQWRETQDRLMSFRSF